jgi:hypothetical protein
LNFSENFLTVPSLWKPELFYFINFTHKKPLTFFSHSQKTTANTILGFRVKHTEAHFSISLLPCRQKKFICRKNGKPICFHCYKFRRRKLNRWKYWQQKVYLTLILLGIPHPHKVGWCSNKINARKFHFLAWVNWKITCHEKNCAYKSNNFIPPNMHINSFHSNMWVKMKNCVIDFISPWSNIT